MKYPKHIVFLKSFLLEDHIPSIYSGVSYHNIKFYSKTSSVQNKFPSVCTIKDIPDYLTLCINASSNTNLKTINTLKGYLVETGKYDTITEYLHDKFGAKRRSNLRRYTKRLEYCFNISYRCYIGEISREKFDFLFENLKHFLEKRFIQKAEKNYELQYLEEYKEYIYPLVCNKEANLFVIYQNESPISIRVNILKKQLGFYIISGYDINYDKFHLGAIDMLKNIEWCINQKIVSYDLLKGYYHYKKDWLTTTYNNKNQIIFSNQLKAILIASFIQLRTLLVYFFYNLLKGTWFYNKYQKLKKKRFQQSHNDLKPEYIITKDPDVKIEDYKPIDISKEITFENLKKPLFDFLFLSREKQNDISIFSDRKNSSHYYIKGKTKSISILMKGNFKKQSETN